MDRTNLVSTTEEYKIAEELFREYAQWLNVDLCFQNFEKEATALHETYNPSTGGIFLFYCNSIPAGCVAIRRFNDDAAEMKRLYVRERFRGRGIGNMLVKKAEELATVKGYKKILLDTLSTMQPAVKLYLANGYVKTEPYYFNPIETAIYFMKEL